MLLGSGLLGWESVGGKDWCRCFLKCLHFVSSSQVHWSGGDVHYQLQSQPAGPFDMDAEGRIHVTAELDREAQAEVR